MLSVVPPRMRPHATALIGIAITAVGGIAGLLLLNGIDTRFGLEWAIASLAVPGHRLRTDPANLGPARSTTTSTS